ncbi:MAG: M13 family peptidase [Rhizobium sp.]|nr:MAG: M13 family peptidase [Rhizobium sp.]
MRIKTLTGVLLISLAMTACNKPPAPAAPKMLKSGINRANFDVRVRPQDDLFRAVNGGWLDKTPIPADKSGYGYTGMVNDQAEAELRTIIENAATSKNAPDSEAQKIGDLYNSFMDEPRAEELGLKPLEAELARIDAVENKADLPALIAHLHRIGVSAPFDGYVHQDAKDSSQYIIDFGQSGLGMPDRDYYLLPDQTFVDLRQQYSAYVEKMFTLAGIDNPALAAQNVVEIETQLAGKQWPQVDVRDADKTYNKLDIAALKKLTPSFDWDLYFKESGIKVPSLVVSEPAYLQAFANISQSMPLSSFKNYYKLRLLNTYAPYLSPAFVDAHFAFNGRALNGKQQLRPRWKRGIELVDDSLGEAAGKIFVAQNFPPANKQRMEQMVKNLLKACGEELDALDWMSADTRKAAKAKLATFNAKIGYPNKWRDYSALKISRDDLVGNVMRASQFEYQRQINKLGQPIDRDEWDMTPQTVNAYYNPERNEIVFPAAILRPPFFDMNADDAVNYGGIGATIGHEISHGFDDQGSKYDGAGNRRDWWTAEDRKNFDERAKRLAAQYAQYEPIPGFHVNGELTLGENIADLGGLVIAYRAYRNSMTGKTERVIDGDVGDQRFFYGYAQSWMEKWRDEYLIRLLKSDPHAPPQYRVNGVVVNVPAFYSTFNVKQGDKMYKPPEARISIW